MTYRNRKKASLRCHQDSKSQLVVNAIEKSCHSMRQCLKENEKFEKYFDEEEFETSHWPCDHCFEPLKGIKMLWKIIVEKLFNVNISKEGLNKENISSDESVPSIVNNWQSEIEVQVDFVKKVALHPNREERIKLKEERQQTSKCLGTNSHRSVSEMIYLKKSSGSLCLTKQLDYFSKGDILIKENEKPSKCLLPKTETVDTGCNTCYFVEEIIELNMYKDKLQQIEEELSEQMSKVETLTKENLQLKSALENCNKNDDLTIFMDPIALQVIPEDEQIGDRIMNSVTDSETVITIKNCTHETFKHVSLLQVLHKSNQPFLNDRVCVEETDADKKDPIALLNRVKNTFGEIVRREVKMVTNGSKRSKKSEINASYHKINVEKSLLSFTTLSSCSLLNVKSTLDT